MSGSMTLALRTAQSGLLANQQALDAVSNNIANVNSPGYSRKVVNLEQRVVSGAGAGVQVSDVVRKVDEGLLKSLRLEISSLNALDARSPYYERLQELFGAPADNTSLSHMTAEFKNAVETLALNPQNTMEQSEVMRRAQAVADKLQFMSDTVQELRLQTDEDITTTVTRVSELLGTVHDLNNKLIANTAIQVDVTDLEDQRDLALDELSGLIDVRYYHRSDGDVVVFTESGRTLVDNSAATLTHLQASAMSPTTTYEEGDINGIYVGASITANDITDEVRNGTLRGLLDMRDSILTNIQSQIDQFASELRGAVNAVHNAGAPFPGLQSVTGTREFIDSSEQTLAYSGNSDTTIVLVDGSGNQTAVTTMRTQLGGASATIDTYASTLQSWLRSNGLNGATVQVNSNGKFAIDLNTTSTSLVFRDQSATANGSTAQDASLTFDINGAGNAGGTETFSGFSNFFGLNDFFVVDQPDNIHDSNVQASTYSLGANTVLTFYNATSTVAVAANMGTVNLTSGMTLDQIATAINNASVGVTATKVADGDGFKLRIAENNGDSMAITSDNTFVADLGLSPSPVRSSTLIKVRDDIQTTPAKISTAALQWDSTKGASGEYLMSAGDDTTVQALNTVLSSNNQFSQAGGLAGLNVTFMSYSTSIISYNSALANTNDTDLTYQASLTASLQAKSDNFRGVNLDEEMTNLMLFEQAYGAAARVISTVQKMFDALENVI